MGIEEEITKYWQNGGKSSHFKKPLIRLLKCQFENGREIYCNISILLFKNDMSLNVMPLDGASYDDDL